ncbi:heme-degrading domain-containing protein [Pseudarthrobacter sulfonivorans]|uniref:heme-degrading domain-containing protein n=1 Tax=Pseudarthrobacter sulfonivorans TaxID=121292 RepID=UPI0021063D09|nr:heme-degrading domain-containing protein [Pseudarthrobacter sulfonivorans]
MTADSPHMTAFDPDSTENQAPGSLEALIARIDAEIGELQFPRFTKDDSLSLGLLLVELGKTRRLPIAIDISKGDQVLFHAALEGATANNDQWIRMKQRAAARYEIPSMLVGLRARLRGGRIEDQGWYDESFYAAHGGCFPVYVAGVGAVATVTVSGLPQQQDHDLVVEALREILGSMRAA